MKTRSLIPLFVAYLLPQLVLGQPDGGVDTTKNIKQEIIQYDLSFLWTKTQHQNIHGFIGEEYQRFQIFFLSVKKDSSHPNTYHVNGKTKVKNNISSFKGDIIIKAAYGLKSFHVGVDETYKGQVKNEGEIIADYLFKEDPKQKFSGSFSGKMTSYWFIDLKNNIRYDTIRKFSDDYCNNQFEGKWKSYDGKLVKKCNWGDFRIPDCQGLDNGAAEFSVSEKYINNGWGNYYQAYLTYEYDDAKSKEARKQEEAEWWK